MCFKKIKSKGEEMIEVKITDEMMNTAKEKASNMRALNNSITHGDGNIAGFVGDQVVKSLIKSVWASTYDYDLITDKGTRIEVKTKRTTVKPKDYYDCSIANFNTKQRCDVYAFVRCNLETREAWFVGWMKKQKYLDKARFMKKGDIDPSNNFTVKADCHNVAIKDLNQGISID